LLGGQPQADYQQWLLMHRSFWTKIPSEPDYWLTDSWGLSQNIKLLNNQRALEPVEFDDYIHPPRSTREKHVMQHLEKHIQSEPDSALLISHLLPFYTANDIKEVSVNGHKVEKLMANIGNSLYYCATCKSGPINWQISIRSNDSEALDMMIIKP